MSAAAARTPFGRVGVLICYDIEFPEMPRSLALRGADLICAPVNWPVIERPPAGEHPPEQLTAMSCARVNRIFMAICDREGPERGVEWVGGTAVIDENGWIAAFLPPMSTSPARATRSIPASATPSPTAALSSMAT